MVAVSVDAQELQHNDYSGDVSPAAAPATTAGAWTIVLEVVIGTWVLLLFLLALAWDPIDRRVGPRRHRIAARAAQRALTAPPATGAVGIVASAAPTVATRKHDTGAYAILPAE
jgi:hypothetical protein